MVDRVPIENPGDDEDALREAIMDIIREAFAAVAISGEFTDLQNIPSLAGWSPILGIAADGERRVVRVINWVGGSGDKPEVGKYLSSAGFVDTAAEATNIRGATGVGGGGGGGGDNFMYINEEFVATGGQTVFTLTAPYYVGYLHVYATGVKLKIGADFTATDGETFTLTVPAAAGETFSAVGYNVFEVADVVPVARQVVAGNNLTGGGALSSNVTLNVRSRFVVTNYTVSSLPSDGTAGEIAYVSNGRKNGEGPGTGTGVMAFHDGTNWKSCDTGQNVAA